MKKMFNVSVEMVVFKNHKVVNRGICESTNGLKDYFIIKTFEKDNKTYTIREKFYNNHFFSKEFEVHDHDKYYIISTYNCPSTHAYWISDTREDK